jgi:hypothetical protein
VHVSRGSVGTCHVCGASRYMGVLLRGPLQAERGRSWPGQARLSWCSAKGAVAVGWRWRGVCHAPPTYGGRRRPWYARLESPRLGEVSCKGAGAELEGAERGRAEGVAGVPPASSPAGRPRLHYVRGWRGGVGFRAQPRMLGERGQATGGETRGVRLERGIWGLRRVLVRVGSRLAWRRARPWGSQGRGEGRLDRVRGLCRW